MKNSIALAVALVAIAIVAAPEANAQNFHNGFQFGSGIHASGGSFGFRSGRVRPPYFAEFPPVYYNGIVRRPYGISPYAAPAGVVPVELNYRPENIAEPIVVSNPHFSSSISKPVSAEEKQSETTDSQTDNKSAKITNPFFDIELLTPAVQASTSVLEPSVESQPEAKAKPKAEAKYEVKSVTITNPFFKKKTTSLSPIMQVSHSVLER